MHLRAQRQAEQLIQNAKMHPVTADLACGMRRHPCTIWDIVTAHDTNQWKDKLASELHVHLHIVGTPP